MFIIKKAFKPKYMEKLFSKQLNVKAHHGHQKLIFMNNDFCRNGWK